MTVVRFAVLPAVTIFNLCSPRWLPEVSRSWHGRRPWHDSTYEPLRDLMERVYVDGFNAASGHYQLLAKSIGQEGFRNPIVVSAGGLDKRQASELPAGASQIVCEYVGGSRLWVAQKLGLPVVPCIVNDHANVLPCDIELRSPDDVRARFTDPPRTLAMNGRGVYLNNLPYMHLPAEKRYGLARQSQIRRGIVKAVQRQVRGWLAAHDGE